MAAVAAGAGRGVSTLALSSAVVFVLGMVLQNQITDRLLETKEEAAIAGHPRRGPVAERELQGVNPRPTPCAPGSPAR